jgi:hypothetical protein
VKPANNPNEQENWKRHAQKPQQKVTPHDIGLRVEFTEELWQQISVPGAYWNAPASANVVNIKTMKSTGRRWAGGASIEFAQTRNVEHVMTYQSESEQPAVVTKTEARQGVTGHNVRYVLGFGLAAVIIAFAIIFYVYFG